MATEPADLPDFDTLTTERTITSVVPMARGVAVTWDDGVEARYHVDWLRENAPDASATHPVTREQTLQLLDIPEDLEASSASVDDAGNLIVRWSTGDVSAYNPGWLRAYTPGIEDTFALPDQILWGQGFADEVPRFDGPKVLADEMELGRWAEAMWIYGFAVLEGLPTTPEVIEEVPARLGPIRTSNFGNVFDVRSKPDPVSNAYTSMTLPLHSDLPTREYAAGLQFLHCLQNEATGGDSILADGFNISRTLQAEDPEAYQALTTIPLVAYNKAKDTDYRWETPMIGLNDDGALDEVRWSPWLRAPLKRSFEETDLVYRSLRTVYALAERADMKIKLRLKPGDLLGFDNRRVLHGRTGYDPETGERWLRGCYVEREELVSRLRIVARHRRAGCC